MKRTISGVVLVVLAHASALGQAGLLVPSSTGIPDASVLSLREMKIDVGIARGYARVSVRQIFENHTADIQEGTYRFRLPPSASVGDFAVWDGLVRIPGVILEKQRARAIYRELTTQRIDPGLLQQGEEEESDEGGDEGAPRPSGGSLFSVTVAPIPPLATKRLELQFSQEVPVVGLLAEMRLALRPPDGEPPVAGRLDVSVTLDDAEMVPGVTEGALPLVPRAGKLVFSGASVPLDRDLVVRLAPRDRSALRLSAYRNPDGGLPDGVSLAPWERPGELPPEPDGFFLLELLAPPREAPRDDAGAPPPPRELAILFDTSLSHRFAGLEAAYAHLVGVLRKLSAEDRFVVVPYDAVPAPDPAGLRNASPSEVEAALSYVRSRPLAPGTDVVAALRSAARALRPGGRILLLTDGQVTATSAELTAARGGVPLFAVVTGPDVPPSLAEAAEQLLPPASTTLEAELLVERLLAPPETAVDATDDPAVPFEMEGGEPGLRDVYPVMIQPIEPGSLSGWIGRYRAPSPKLRITLGSSRLAAPATLDAGLPERAVEARDLPRRWARARVDDLLRRIEAEGERREWVEEIIELSSRYKFVTPYTAFLAAPRSLLRPRRIQPGDPVLRVACDPGTTSVVALFPFGLRLPLARRPGTDLWEGRFLVPEGLADGRRAVRIVLRDGDGRRVTETKHFVLDGTPPRPLPDPVPPARAGDVVPISARVDSDTVSLSARMGDAPPAPLRWDPGARRCVGRLHVPPGTAGPVDVTFQAVDGANNIGFARVRVEVLP